MPRVAPGQRKRAYRPKSRTGCTTCKVRRIKCDEATPLCNSCISTGRKCDGYLSRTELPQDLSNTVLGTPSTSPSIGFLNTANELRSFYFFRLKTGPQLSKYFGGDFWERLLLQAALHEPSIRHAILTLGSLHAKLEDGNVLIKQSHASELIDDFATRKYSEAINILVQPAASNARQAIDVCLICSILFACLETMQGNYGSAITHVQSGVKILCEVKYNDKTRRRQHDMLGVSEIPYVSLETIENMFVRLDLQVVRMVNTHNWKPHETVQDALPGNEMPAIFSSLSNAREAFLSCWHIASYSTRDIWDPASDKLPRVPPDGAWQDKSASILGRWSSAYDAYLNFRGDNLTYEKKKGTAALSILKELGSTVMMLSRTTVDDPVDWDAFCSTFENVVSLAEDIVDLDQIPAEEKSIYCIRMAIVRTLFEISCRCRDPLIRRRAISLLVKCGRIEGTWTAFSTSKVAKRVLDIEESGLENVRSCDDVPRWARISNVVPVFDLIDRNARLTYSRLESKHSVTRQTVEEVVEW